MNQWQWQMSAHNQASPQYGFSPAPYWGTMAYQPPYAYLPVTYHGMCMHGQGAPLAGLVGGMMTYQQPHTPLPAYHGIAMYGSYPMPPVAASSYAEGMPQSSSKSSAAAAAAGKSRTSPRSSSSRTKKAHHDFKGTWGKRYSQLKEFKEANGHCNVPQRYKANVGLGRWVKVSKSRMHQHQMLIEQS